MALRLEAGMSKWHHTTLQTLCPLCSPSHNYPFYQEQQTQAAHYSLRSKASRAITDEQDLIYLCADTTTVTSSILSTGQISTFGSSHSPPKDKEIPQREARTA